MNRAVAVNDASIEAVKATHASVIHEKNERRGNFCLAAEGAAGFAAGGLAGAAGGVGSVAAGLPGGGFRESALLIVISPIITNQGINIFSTLPGRHRAPLDQDHYE